jgi:hypothetical protein
MKTAVDFLAKTNPPAAPMLILFKFGTAKNLRAFREQGLMHMKTMSYFAQQEANLARRDRLEGTSSMYQPFDIGDFNIESPLLGKYHVDPKELAGPVVLSVNHEAERNIFCMFAITGPQETPLLNSANLDFGDSFVLVLNRQAFFDSIRKTAVRLGLKVEAGLIQYFDEHTYSGKIGAFRKSSQYSHQREFRMVVQPGLSPYRELVLGSLKDITTPVLPLSDLDKLVNFTPASARDAGLI